MVLFGTLITSFCAGMFIWFSTHSYMAAAFAAASVEFFLFTLTELFEQNK